MTQPRSNPESSGEPLPGYDALTAAEVVQRLAILSPSQRAAVDAYELANQARRPVLRRAAELSGRVFVERARKEA